MQRGDRRRARRAARGRPRRVAPLVLITTSGDRIQDRRLLEAGGKGLFTKEIEEALLDGRIDCAVHSYKDVPAEAVPGLVIAAVPEREDPRDAFLSLLHATFDQPCRRARASAPPACAAAPRRCTAAPTCRCEMMRGNVDTRLAKLERGDADAIILAIAGLRRLGLERHVRELLDPVAAPPAPGQGALAIQTRAGRRRRRPGPRALHHRDSAVTVAAERGALVALEGSCRTAIGAHARLDGGVADADRRGAGARRLPPAGAASTPTTSAPSPTRRAPPPPSASASASRSAAEAGDRLVLPG